MAAGMVRRWADWRGNAWVEMKVAEKADQLAVVEVVYSVCLRVCMMAAQMGEKWVVVMAEWLADELVARMADELAARMADEMAA